MFLSLPAWGVWIEIFARIKVFKSHKCRSPHGECGLKSTRPGEIGVIIQSLPAWGVWIEIKSKTLVT